MKNKKTVIAVILLAVLTASAYTQQGGKSINSVDELKKYLDSQPANSRDKPIKVAMMLNEPMFPKVRDVINGADKYVSLDLTGSPTTIIPNKAFDSCKLLVGIIIPKGVTEIDRMAFWGCSSLSSVIIPNSVTKIGGRAFYACGNLTSVTIPASVIGIWDWAFWDCSSLNSVTFETGSNIDDNYFWDNAFIGNLIPVYAKGKAGTYTRAADGKTWTKQ